FHVMSFDPTNGHSLDWIINRQRFQNFTNTAWSQWLTFKLFGICSKTRSNADIISTFHSCFLCLFNSTRGDSNDFVRSENATSFEIRHIFLTYMDTIGVYGQSNINTIVDE